MVYNKLFYTFCCWGESSNKNKKKIKNLIIEENLPRIKLSMQRNGVCEGPLHCYKRSLVLFFTGNTSFH